MTGIDELRRAVRLFDRCNESFNTTFAADELLLVADALRRSEWDILPDQWEERQIELALLGIVPTWEDTASGPVPTYMPGHEKP